MNNLTEKMQERLEKWRNRTIPAASAEKIREAKVKFTGKGDFGDVQTLEDWEYECHKSQTRR